MKKLLRLLFILLILGLGFLYIVKNPELWISQTILKAIGLERLTISDEPIAMGTGTFTLDEIGTTFTLPIDRTLSGAVMTGNEETTFILSTPEVDNKKYPMYIRGSVQKSTDTLEEVQQTFQVQLTGNGQTFSIDCDGVSPSKCLGVFINSGIYIVGLSSQSDQPDEDLNAPTSVYFPRFAQIQDAINAILYSAVVVPPVMTGSELSGENLSSFSDSELGTTFSYPTTRGTITKESENNLSGMKYMITLLSNGNIFFAAYNNEIPLPRWSFFWDQAKNIINSAHITNFCDNKTNCNILTNTNNIPYAKYYEEYGEMGSTQTNTRLMYYIFNPSNAFRGIVISNERMSSVPETDFDILVNSLQFN